MLFWSAPKNPTLRWGHYTCDGRRSITEIQAEFPDCDFSEVHYTRKRPQDTAFSWNIPCDTYFLIPDVIQI